MRDCMAKLEEFAKGEQERLDSEGAQRMQELGYNPSYVFDNGDSDVLEFQDAEVREYESKFGTRKAFVVNAASVPGTAFDFSVNPRSPLYRQIVTELAAGHRKLQITRVGEGVETQYSVKPVA